MTGYYKSPAEAGKCYPCKSCQKTPTVGQDRYYEKITVTGQDGGKTEVWAGCVDFECFKKQGGSSEPAQQKKPFTPTKFPITDAPKIMNLAEEMLAAFLNKRKDDTLTMENQSIFIESIFRTLSSCYKP